MHIWLACVLLSSTKHSTYVPGIIRRFAGSLEAWNGLDETVLDCRESSAAVWNDPVQVCKIENGARNCEIHDRSGGLEVELDKSRCVDSWKKGQKRLSTDSGSDVLTGISGHEGTVTV